MDKENIIELVKGSIKTFELRNNNLSFKKSSKNITTQNYVELTNHTSGLKDAYVLGINYTDGSMKCSMCIGPITLYDNLGKPYFEKYHSYNQIIEKQNLNIVSMPTLDFTIEEFENLKIIFQTEFEQRKLIYAKELEDGKIAMLEKWKRDII